MEKFNSHSKWQNYRIKLYNLRSDQIEYMKRISDARRFTYNWALETCNKSYEETGKIPGFFRLCRMFTEYKKKDGLEWLDSMLVEPCRYAIKDLLSAFHNFFLGICKHPIFKSKKVDRFIRFAVRADNLKFYGNSVHIPGISKDRYDYIECKNHNIPYGPNIKYDNVRVKFDGLNYWLTLSISYKKPIVFDELSNSNEPLGIDVGIKSSAILSNGKVFDRPDMYRLGTLEHRRRKLQSAVDRDVNKRLILSKRTRTKYEKIQKSKNQIKREKRLAKTRLQIHNFYNYHYHKISREIANMCPKWICIEDLHTSNMMSSARNLRYQRRLVYESRMATLVEYITYKCEDAGVFVIKAPRNFKSTQRCSNCESEYKIGKSRIYNCPNCGLVIDRDLNAALNLRNYGFYYMDQLRPLD